jgi:hypothetical protein
MECPASQQFTTPPSFGGCAFSTARHPATPPAPEGVHETPEKTWS